MIDVYFVFHSKNNNSLMNFQKTLEKRKWKTVDFFDINKPCYFEKNGEYISIGSAYVINNELDFKKFEAEFYSLMPEDVDYEASIADEQNLNFETTDMNGKYVLGKYYIQRINDFSKLNGSMFIYFDTELVEVLKILLKKDKLAFDEIKFDEFINVPNSDCNEKVKVLKYKIFEKGER